MISFTKFLKERQFSQTIALLLLLILLAMGAVPGYLTGRWQWHEPAPIPTLQQLKQIRQKGLNLSGWKTLSHEEQQIGGRKWLYQLIQKATDQKKAILFLLPQNGPRDQPQVEWSEMASAWQWDVAQERSVSFIVPQDKSSNTQIKARFLRAVTRQQTFAVLQWYAWKNGGDFSPLPWYVVDQLAQWRQQRTPWVAVSILIFMEPLGQIDKVWQDAQSLGQTVQAILEKNGL